MALLKIIYSHKKEIYIVDKYKDAFEEYGEEVPDIEKPADKTRADEVVENLKTGCLLFSSFGWKGLL